MAGFAELKLFPCPAGDKCTAFQCMFGHGSGKEAGSADTAAATAATATGSSTPDDKPGQSQRHPPQTPGHGVNAKTASKPALSSDQCPDDSSHALLRPISPPLLKRKAPSSPSPAPPASHKRPAAHAAHRPSTFDSPARFATPKTGSTTTIPPQSASSVATPLSRTQPTSYQPTSPSPSASSNPSTPAPVSRKPETLKPRFLHKAPSSYETRFKLIKLLHAEFTRLNSQLQTDLKSSTDPDEGLGLVLTDQEIIWKTLDAEEKAAVDKPSIYNNILRNLIMQYKRMTIKQWREERIAARPAATREPKSRSCKAQDQPKKVVTGLSTAQEVAMLRRIITPIDQLSAHGYVSTAPTEAEVQKARAGLEAAAGWEKCDRCTKRFQVIPGRREDDGSLTSGGKCVFHPGKQYLPERPPGDRTRVPKRYRCCGEQVGDSAGCTDSPHHVFKATDPKRLATILNFAETPANPSVPADRAVCFDCEMCYTVHGLELVRLTATSWPMGEELLDTLVLPVGQILDLNSRYSGVWPDDLAKAVPWSAADTAQLRSAEVKRPASEKPEDARGAMKVVASPEAARELLFALISPETPLIGHGLENDLNSVRIIHPTIIDTVLLYPHKQGLPYRYGLKMLMDSLLNRKIQVETNGKAQGHDSAEDARAAGELVHLKIMNKWRDMRLDGWTLDKDSGDFVEPPKRAAAPPLTVEFLEAAH